MKTNEQRIGLTERIEIVRVATEKRERRNQRAPAMTEEEEAPMTLQRGLLIDRAVTATLLDLRAEIHDPLTMIRESLTVGEIMIDVEVQRDEEVQQIGGEQMIDQRQKIVDISEMRTEGHETHLPQKPPRMAPHLTDERMTMNHRLGETRSVREKLDQMEEKQTKTKENQRRSN